MGEFPCTEAYFPATPCSMTRPRLLAIVVLTLAVLMSGACQYVPKRLPRQPFAQVVTK